MISTLPQGKFIIIIPNTDSANIDLGAGLKDYIISEDLLTPTDQVLVAVSGGVDSVVLAYLLNELGYSITIAHANFQLRAGEADLDEKLVREMSEKLNTPFCVKKFDTKSYAKDHGVSTQMAARSLRYQWFDELQQVHNLQKVATAHHLNDVLETLLLNIAKGTGIAGLHGILPQRGSLIRPLIFADKEQIAAYAISNQLKWRDDTSNASEHYQRNLIRNQVVPVLKRINPKIEASTKNTVEILRSVEKQYQQSIEHLRNELMTPDGDHLRISKAKLTEVEPAIFAELIREYGFNFQQSKSILTEAFEHTGGIFQSISHNLNIDRDDIIISPNIDDTVSLELDSNRLGSIDINGQQWFLSRHQIEQYTISREPSVGAFDLDKLSFPLTVRKWKSGDKFFPLGMNHGKKISDFLVDEKVPLNYKSGIQVVVSGGDIMWVAGYRIDDRYKVTGKTKRVLEIEIRTLL